MQRRSALQAMLFVTGISSLGTNFSEAETQQRPHAWQFSSVEITERSAREFYAAIKKPATPFELLDNIRLAIDKHLLLREDFYTEENLKLFFGGDRVEWRSDDDLNKRRGEIIGFNSMVEPVRLKTQVLAGISLSFSRIVKESGKTEARLHMVIRGNSRLDFDAVEKIFGTEWKPSREGWRVQHWAVYHEPTQLHGNEHIEYTADDAGIQRLIDMRFSHDARLLFADFVEVRNSGPGLK